VEINYTKTVFSWGSAPDPITRELMSCLGSQACEICGRACRAMPPNADAPVFFPANMCHSLFLSTFLVLSLGTITMMHFTVSIIICTGNQNKD